MDIEKISKQPFSIPESAFLKLAKLTGGDNCYKGIFAFFINEEGEPQCFVYAQDTATYIAIEQAVVEYVHELEDRDTIVYES